MSECKVISIVLVHTVTPYLSKPKGLGSIPNISHFFKLCFIKHFYDKEEFDTHCS